LGDETKKNKITGACGMNGGEEKYVQGFDGETFGKESTWKI
jgi:hypothetical protein